MRNFLNIVHQKSKKNLKFRSNIIVFDNFQSKVNNRFNNK